jgi:hypothetical protein
VLERVREPFPVAVRTLDALHLAAAYYMRARSAELRVAHYDRPPATSADALELPLADLD